jgi:hypothetical protein
VISVFTFNLVDLKYQIRKQGTEWIAPCKAEFIDSNRDSFPLRGDVTFLNSLSAELSLKLFTEPLNSLFMRPGLDEQVKEWRVQNYPCDDDAYVLGYWPKSEDFEELLGMTAAFRPDKFQAMQQFLHAHIGRKDLFGRLICQFDGFQEEDFENPTLPTEEAFLRGAPYFVMCDHSLTFSATLP